MTAEVLREAAALMRSRAEAATPGPWRQGAAQDGEVLADGTGYAGDYEPTSDVFALDSEGYCLTEFSAGRARDAEHIASWHPAVALAVARLLDHMATGIVSGNDLDWPNSRDIADALAVARAYLGGAS